MTTATDARGTLIAALDAAEYDVRAAVAGMSDAELQQPVNRWSAHAIMAHLAGWEEQFIRDLVRAGLGRTGALLSFREEDVDRWNDAFLLTRLPLPPAQVVTEAAEAWDALRQMLLTLPDEAFAEGTPVSRFGAISIEHKHGHASEIASARVKSAV